MHETETPEMMQRTNRWLLTRHRNEQGVEAAAIIFVFPLLFVLVLALIDIGLMFDSRAQVENIARNAVREVAADGGNNNPLTVGTGQPDVDTMYRQQLVAGGTCLVGHCTNPNQVILDCGYVTPMGGIPPTSDATAGQQFTIVRTAGEIVTCHLYYPYKPINSALWNSAMGLHMSSLYKPFNYWVSARAETGCQAYGASDLSTCDAFAGVSQ